MISHVCAIYIMILLKSTFKLINHKFQIWNFGKIKENKVVLDLTIVKYKRFMPKNETQAMMTLGINKNRI